jgi:formylglycine-generating enzyme required for sulfatase activity
MVFCYVPAGKAKLGSTKAERAAVVKAIGDDREPGWLRAEGEEARGAFETKGFWLGKYEVTRDEWMAVVGENPGGKPQNPVKGVDAGRLPAEPVSWNESQKFLGVVNKRAGAAAVFGRAGQFCLPHEDEWEYACRGGKGNERAFYWGGELNGTQANCHGYFPFGTDKKGPSPSRPTPVGSYAKDWPHPWGLCDMHGNLWEWCENEFDDVNHLRVKRGGSHSIYAVRCRAAARNRSEPFLGGFDSGFRVCFRPAE